MQYYYSVQRSYIPPCISTNGKSLVKDEETGLLHLPNHVVGFTLKKKIKFLEIAPQFFPDLTAVCDIIGISKNAYKTHYNLDPVFRAKMDAIEESLTDKIEARMATFAMEKGNFMDRIAWLRAHRGEKYNEKKQISIDVNVSQNKIENKSSELAGALDTELISDAQIVPIAPAEPSTPNA